MTDRATSVADRAREVLARATRRDPEHDALRRAVRAAVILPLTALAGVAAGGGSQTTMFAIFGAVALLIVADFPGNRPARALAYCGLGCTGAALITLGTLISPLPAVAVLTMFVLGVTVTFAGVLSELIAAGQRATLMTFVLPVCTPPGPIAERLSGWAIAWVIAVPAALWLWAPTHHDDLRRHAAQVCRVLATRLSGTAGADELDDAMGALHDNFLGADFRPVGLTAGSRALVRVIDDLRWLCDRATDGTALLLDEMRAPAVWVLIECAQVLSTSRADGRDGHRQDLTAALAALRRTAHGRYRDDIEQILAEPDNHQAAVLGRKLLQLRTFTACIGVVGRVIGVAADADARPVWARALGRGLPATGIADRVLSESQAVANIPSGFVATRAVVVRNSIRTGLGLAAAVVVVHTFAVQNGFWVVLAASSVLRGSALTTSTRILRAVTGTVVGFVLGTLIIGLLGVHPALLWMLLPVVAFGAAYLPNIVSFTAGQAFFTMLVLTIYNLLHPTGWRVGLIRLQDVAVGALVGIVVSLLLWPRGAAAVVHRALRQSLTVGARYLDAAVRRVTRGASEAATDRVHALSHDALAASRTVDDAVRQILSEGSGDTDQRASIVRAANETVRLRTSADLIADVTPPPLQAYPAARAVLEKHTALIADRIATRTSTPPPALSDDFVHALRAEAADLPLPAEAALPLVMVAAALGELELLSVPPLAEVRRP